MKRVKQSFEIMENSLLSNGMWAASTSSDYNFTWFRDTAYIALSYLYKNCNTYMNAYHGILDILKEYEWKLDMVNKNKPNEMWEYPHIRYSAFDFKEVDTPWSHIQYDAYGAILFGIGKGESLGKKIIRNEDDKRVIQKLVGFLEKVEYWNDPDSGTWEENLEVRSSSIAAVIAGLEAVSNIVYVPSNIIHKGYETLYSLFPRETATRDADLFQLTLIYPYNLLSKPLAQKIINHVEENLLRDKGGLRYKGDSYYSTLEKEHGRNMPLDFYYGSEAEWTFFYSFMALALMKIGEFIKAKTYIDKVESVMLDDGRLPELYFAGNYKDEKGNNYNGNTPLIWSNAMYVQAKEMYLGGM